RQSAGAALRRAAAARGHRPGPDPRAAPAGLRRADRGPGRRVGSPRHGAAAPGGGPAGPGGHRGDPRQPRLPAGRPYRGHERRPDRKHRRKGEGIMMRKWSLPLLAVGMLVFTIFHMVEADQGVPKSKPPVEPPRPHTAHVVAGSGIVEPQTENISIGSHLSG